MNRQISSPTTLTGAKIPGRTVVSIAGLGLFLISTGPHRE